MKECGVSVDKESISVFYKQMEGKDLVTLTKEGKEKLISFPSCGGGAPMAAGGAAAASAAPVEEKKEEPEDVDMGGLFGGDDDDY